MSIAAIGESTAFPCLTSEQAYWQLLTKGIEDPQGPYTRHLVGTIVNETDPEWAYETLYAAWLINAKDPENPKAEPIPLITDAEQRALFRNIRISFRAALYVKTMRTVYLPADQKETLIRRLGEIGDREQSEEAIAFCNLTEVQKMYLRAMALK